LLSKITIALRKLTKEELQVFNMMFYENRKDDYILSNVPFCEDIIYTIKKSACIKFVVALGIDYDKNDRLYFCNTEYTEEMETDNWILLEDVFE